MQGNAHLQGRAKANHLPLYLFSSFLSVYLEVHYEVGEEPSASADQQPGAQRVTPLL